MLYLFQRPDDCDVVWRHLAQRSHLQVEEWREWEKILRAWQAGAVSNYHYLMHVNSMGHRSLNDLAQYPVLPWVLRDYSSATIDVDDPEVYRDLSKPMGALNEARLARLVARYHAMARPKFLYGTHYSAPAHVLYYLVRSAPLHCLRLHGGKFDLPDRSFHSIHDTWTACTTHDADVKELIPEFFDGQGHFLQNRQGLDLGATQGGEPVADVQLPPWARGSAAHFVAVNRKALESQQVSDTLHQWVDLIFGHKQRGDRSKLAFNVFHPLTYEGQVDINSIEDEAEQYAVIQQISEFGQTPKLLFTQAHPARGPGPCIPHSALPLQHHPHRRSRESDPAAVSDSARAGVVGDLQAVPWRDGREEAGGNRSGGGSWGAKALEQAALDHAVAVVAGRGQEAAQLKPSLRPLIEGSDSDADAPSWTPEVPRSRSGRAIYSTFGAMSSARPRASYPTDERGSTAGGSCEVGLYGRSVSVSACNEGVSSATGNYTRDYPGAFQPHITGAPRQAPGCCFRRR